MAHWIIAQEEIDRLVREAAKHVNPHQFNHDAFAVRAGGRPTRDTMHNFIRGRFLFLLVQLQRKASWFFKAHPTEKLTGVPLHHLTAPGADQSNGEETQRLFHSYATDVIPTMFRHTPDLMQAASGIVKDCLTERRNSVVVARSIRDKDVERNMRQLMRQVQAQEAGTVAGYR